MNLKRASLSLVLIPILMHTPGVYAAPLTYRELSRQAQPPTEPVQTPQITELEAKPSPKCWPSRGARAPSKPNEDIRRIHLPFRVAYGSDKGRVKPAVVEAANRLGHTLKTRDADVWLTDFADDALVFELVVWVTPTAVKRPQAVNANYRWAIETALRDHGIEIPLPQRDLRLRSDLQAFLRTLLGKQAP